MADDQEATGERDPDRIPVLVRAGIASASPVSWSALRSADARTATTLPSMAWSAGRP